MERPDPAQESSQTIATRLRQGIGTLVAFARDRVSPAMLNFAAAHRGESMPRHQALGQSFFIVSGWATTLSEKLDSPIHDGAIASAGRSCFELEVDMRLLEANKDGKAGERYMAYRDVERFNLHSKIYDFYTEKHYLDRPPNWEMITRTMSNKKLGGDMDKTLLDNWGSNRTREGKRKFPNHWSGINDFKERAAACGNDYLIRYYQTYKMFSWFVHASGGTGYGFTDHEGIHHEVCAMGFNAGFMAMHTAIDIVLRVYDLDPQIRAEFAR